MDRGVKLWPMRVSLMFVEEFHLGLLSGLESFRSSAREKLREGVGVV